MNKRNRMVTIDIDNQVLRVPHGLTILEAARRHDIYIPTLCAHPSLTPYGGCRLCIVEVEGMRGFPTACTTPVEEGMVIRTRTIGIQAERQEIMQLILSEHTSSCLICDQKDDCRSFMSTIRKVGVTTGCRYCPNDDQCELQDVVAALELKEINYPISYRHLPVEKDDPFYDRDYNLCILCGRCIRMCQEIRTANVLAFKQRGRQTVIGPAFGRSHLEAGCEFCGACVSVCPTGALAEKTRKWDGRAEREVVTTCALCGLGCQMRLLIKGDRVIGTLPVEEAVVNRGQLCVKGRFGVAELVNHHHRLKKPYRVENDTRVEISWDQAVGQAAEKLVTCPAERFGMIVSKDCTNEDLYVAQKFVRLAMGSHHVDTMARSFYGPAFNAYLDLFRRSLPLAHLERSDVILCLGLDTRYGRSVVGVELRRAIKRGAKLITFHPRNHNLTLIASLWLEPAPGDEERWLTSLVRMTEKKGSPIASRHAKSQGAGHELVDAARLLTMAKEAVILVGPEFLPHDRGAAILGLVAQLADHLEAGVLPLPSDSNLLGSLMMGAYPELSPGGRPSADKKSLEDLGKFWGTRLAGMPSRWNVLRLSERNPLAVLYLVGETLPQCHQVADYVIYQNVYPPNALCRADLVLPTAAFTEIDGTVVNGEGRWQRQRRGVSPPGQAKPDWEILCRIAARMNKRGFDFSSVGQIQREIARVADGFGQMIRTSRRTRPMDFTVPMSTAPRQARASRGKGSRDFLLFASALEHTYRGSPLTSWIEGAKRLFPEGTVAIHPTDAKRIGVVAGDEVIVSWGKTRRNWTAQVTEDQPRGSLHVVLPLGLSLEANPQRARIRKKR